MTLVQLFEQFVVALCIWWTRCREPKASAEPETGSGILLGYQRDVHDDQRVAVRLSWPDVGRHLAIFGSSGSGKTTTIRLIVKAAIEAGRNVLVLDKEGDFVDTGLRTFAPVFANDPERLVLIDLRQSEFVVGLNPLAGSDDPYTAALTTLAVMEAQAATWGNRMADTGRNGSIALAQAGMSIADLLFLLADQGFRDRVIARTTDVPVRQFLERFSVLSRAEQLTWASPVANKISGWLATPRTRMALGSGTSLDWSQVIDTPGRVVLIALDGSHLGSTANLIGALILTQLWNAVLARSKTPQVARNKVLAVVDEFRNFNSPFFEGVLAEGRRFGLSLILAQQNLSQTDSRLLDSIRHNTGTTIAMQTGSGDAAHLAADVIGLGSREQVRSILIGQGVGEGILMRRGQPSELIKTIWEPEPKTDPALVKLVRDRALATYGRPFAEVEREINERWQVTSSVATGTLTEEEVRRAERPKRPTF